MGLHLTGSSVTQLNNAIDGRLPVITCESQGAAPGNTASQNVTAIQAALTAANTRSGAVVTLRTPGTYLINTRLLIYSNTTFDIGPGVTIKRADNSGSIAMIRNANMADAASTGGDHDIVILGGIWDGNVANNSGAVVSDSSSAKSGVQGNVSLIGVRNSTVRGLQFMNMRNHCLQVLGNDLLIQQITLVSGLTGFVDGVHVSGPSARVTIDNITGYCHDDFVALTAWDWAASSPVVGDITDVVIRNLHPQVAAGQTITGNVVKMLPGTRSAVTGNVRRVHISDVQGTAANDAFTAYTDPGDGTGASGVGTVSDVIIERVNLQLSNSGCVSRLLNTVDSWTVRDVNWSTPQSTGGWIAKVDATYTVNKLTLDGIRYSGTSGYDQFVLIQGTLTELRVTNCYLIGVNNGTTNSGSDTSGIVVGSNGTLNKLLVSNVHQKFGANLLYMTSGATGTLVDAVMSAVYLDGMKRLLMIEKGTLNLRASASLFANLTVEVGRTNGATASLVARFAGCEATYNGGTTITNVSGTIRITGDLAIDVTKTKNNGYAAGDMVKNSNGALGCGTGWVITDGTTWKNLYSAATY